MAKESTPYLGEGHVGDDDRVEGRGGILGGDAGVTTGVVLVLALTTGRLPRLAVGGLGNGALGRSAGGGTGCSCERCRLSRVPSGMTPGMGSLTEVPSRKAEDTAHDGEENLESGLAFTVHGAIVLILDMPVDEARLEEKRFNTEMFVLAH